jgi:hypothetical protein
MRGIEVVGWDETQATAGKVSFDLEPCELGFWRERNALFYSTMVQGFSATASTNDAMLGDGRDWTLTPISSRRALQL